MSIMQPSNGQGWRALVLTKPSGMLTLSTLCCTEKAENLYLSQDVFGLGERGPNVGAVTRSVVARVLAYALRSGRLAADKNRMTLMLYRLQYRNLLPY